MLTPSSDSSPSLASNLPQSDTQALSQCRDRRDETYQIRSARRQDISELADLLTSSFHSQDGWMRWVYPILRLGIYEDLHSRLRSPAQHYACLAAVDRLIDSAGNSSTRTEIVVGTVEMAVKKAHLWQASSRHDSLYISNLAVHDQYRRRGVGLRLLQTCEQVARDWKYKTLYLHVLETNMQARGLYQKAGYQIQATENDLSTWLWGQPRKLLLRKFLT